MTGGTPAGVAPGLQERAGVGVRVWRVTGVPHPPHHTHAQIYLTLLYKLHATALAKWEGGRPTMDFVG